MFLLVPAHPGSPGPKAVKRLCACVCVCDSSIDCGTVVATSWAGVGRSEVCGAGCTWSESRDADTPPSAAVTPGPVCHAERPPLSPGDDGMPSSSTSAYSSTAGSTSAEVDRDIVSTTDRDRGTGERGRASTTDRDSARHRDVDREKLSARVAVVRPLTPCADDEQTGVKTNDDDSDDEETGLKSVVTAGLSTHHADSGISRRHSDDVSVNGVSRRPIDGAIGVTTDSSDTRRVISDNCDSLRVADDSCDTDGDSDARHATADSSDTRRVTIGISDMSLLILVTLGVPLMTVVTLGVSLLTSVTVCMLLVTVVTVTLGMSLNR